MSICLSFTHGFSRVHLTANDWGNRFNGLCRELSMRHGLNGATRKPLKRFGESRKHRHPPG